MTKLVCVHSTHHCNTILIVLIVVDIVVASRNKAVVVA